jgi:glycolate oxidase FAD binding subunit
MSVLQAPIEVKQEVDVWGYRGNGVALMHQLKHQFDPENILNPHRCFGVD